MTDMSELELRVGEKWTAVAAARLDPDTFDIGEWAVHHARDGDVRPLSAGVLQFPCEQWASCPAKRTLALLACEAMLDRADTLTDEQWTMLCVAVQYGGKMRIA